MSGGQAMFLRVDKLQVDLLAPKKADPNAAYRAAIRGNIPE
jgi:hypothetical protein